MKTIAQILRSKPDQTVHTMEPTASAYEGAKYMAEKNIGALVVKRARQSRRHRLGARLRAQARGHGPRFAGHSVARHHVQPGDVCALARPARSAWR